MKIKFKKILIILTLVILSITGCSSNTNDNNKSGNSKDKEDSIKVVTSFYPMYLLASNVVKDIDNVELINMTNSATGCLHDYSLTTDNIKLLEDCDVFIINGAGMESFLDKVLEQKPDLKIIDASEGIELIKSDYMDESHNHDHGHDHDEEYNPHVWLSVENAIKQVENIENKLIEYNSINKDKYSQNAREYIEQLSNLDNKIHSELDNIKNKNIVTFHEAFPYFAKEYGLNIVGVVQREAGSEPSAKELQETIEKINNPKLNISIGDLHEKNIIIDDKLNLHFIDIDSYKVENIEFGSKYLYKLENTNQSVNTDRYCLMIMILNYLMNNKNTLFTDLNEYEKDNYLKKFSKKEIKLINQLNYKKEFKLSSKDIDLLFKNHNNKRYIKEESICDISDKELQSLIQNIKQRVRSI